MLYAIQCIDGLTIYFLMYFGINGSDTNIIASTAMAISGLFSPFPSITIRTRHHCGRSSPELSIIVLLPLHDNIVLGGAHDTVMKKVYLQGKRTKSSIHNRKQERN